MNQPYKPTTPRGMSIEEKVANHSIALKDIFDSVGMRQSIDGTPIYDGAFGAALATFILIEIFSTLNRLSFWSRLWFVLGGRIDKDDLR